MLIVMFPEFLDNILNYFYVGYVWTSAMHIDSPHTLSEIGFSHNYCANVNSNRETKPILQEHEHNDHLAR